jgi:diguanylate cyclase (GGDEF)-like protein
LCEELEKHERPSSPEEPVATPPPPTPLRDDLATARAEYARALPGKLRDLARAIREAKLGNDDIATARLRAHKLRGTAGCFGFEEVGTAAGAIEDALEATRVADGAMRERAWETVEDTVESARAAALRARREATGPSAPGGVGRAHLLVVGDDTGLLARLERVGQGQLFDVAHAPSAAEALGSACQQSPDAALIDLRPTSSEVSFELARQLRALPQAEHLPIAFFAATDSIELRVAAARAGASLYLTRIVDDDTLALSVRQLLAARKAERPRVLIVDDNDMEASLLADVLEHHGMVAECLADATRIIEALEESRPDLLLVDLTMPRVNGLDVCRIVRTSPVWQDLPTLVVTGRIDAQSRLAALRAGADGYIVKPIVEQELVARIVARIDRLQMVRERYDKDSLTGLPLRRSFLERLARSMAESRRHSRPLTVALLDVDRFKLINDTYGHQAGDRVLAALGRLLDARFRAEDLRGRWGGEEFVLAFPGQPPRPLRSAIGAALGELAALTFRGAKGEPFRVTFSAGLSGYPDDGLSVEALLEAADRRLYEAKRVGRARVISA